MKLCVPQLGEGLDSVKIIDQLIGAGELLKKDQCYVSVETDKSAVDLEVACDGQLVKWLCDIGDEIKVGEVIAEFKPLQEELAVHSLEPLITSDVGKKQQLKKELAELFIPPKTRRYIQDLGLSVKRIEDFFIYNVRVLLPSHVDEYVKQTQSFIAEKNDSDIFIASMASYQGSKTVNNNDLGFLDNSIFRTTGIKSRKYIDVDKKESTLSLACRAASACLEKAKTNIEDVSFVVCATGTPSQVTPSMANSILNTLSKSTSTSYLGAAV